MSNPDEPIFHEIRGTEYTTIRTRTFRITIGFVFFVGLALGVPLGLLVAWLAGA